MVVEGKENLVRKSYDKKLKKVLIKQEKLLNRTIVLKTNIKLKKFIAATIKSLKKSSERILVLRQKLLNQKMNFYSKEKLRAKNQNSLSAFRK